MHTILITGANRGLGLEFARQYAEQGWRVLACCRNPQSADELNLIQTEHAETVHVYPLDVSNLNAIEKLAQQLNDVSIDVLLNNAGTYGSPNHSFGQVDYQDWSRTFLINTIAPMKMAETFIKHVTASQMKKMIFLTSKMGSQEDNTSGGSYIYRSSKSALNAVVKSLSIDFKPLGVSVLILHPGWVKTDMGGPHALISAEQSVKSIRELIQGLTLDGSGLFLDYQGNIIPW